LQRHDRPAGWPTSIALERGKGPALSQRFREWKSDPQRPVHRVSRIADRRAPRDGAAVEELEVVWQVAVGSDPDLAHVLVVELPVAALDRVLGDLLPDAHQRPLGRAIRIRPQVDA